MNMRTPKPAVPGAMRPGRVAMAADALRMLARQLRVDPNPDAIEDTACALEAVAIERELQAHGLEAGPRDASTPDRPFVSHRSRLPGVRQAMMQALEDDMEARRTSIGARAALPSWVSAHRRCP